MTSSTSFARLPRQQRLSGRLAQESFVREAGAGVPNVTACDINIADLAAGSSADHLHGLADVWRRDIQHGDRRIERSASDARERYSPARRMTRG